MLPPLDKVPFQKSETGDYTVIGEQKPYLTATYDKTVPGYLFLNVPIGNYIITVNGAGNFATYWRIVTVWKSTHTFNLPVSPTTFASSTTGSLRVSLEWFDDSQDLDLYATFNINATADCVVDGISSACQGLRSHTDQYHGSVVDVDSFGSYYYLFFVKKFIPSNWTTQSGDFVTQSGATVKIYLPGFNYAPYQFNIPPITWSDNVVPQSDSMVWLAFCMDGSVGPLSITPVSDFWNGTLSNGGSIPNSNICQYYLDPASYAIPGSSQGL